MSYPPPTGYHNETGQQSQNYMSARNSSGTSHTYAQRLSDNADNQRTQYAGSSYDWSRQEQQPSQKPAEASQAQVNNWRGAEPVTYDYSRQNNYYVQSYPAATDGYSYTASARDPFGHTTKALSSLAYASTLKPEVSRQENVSQASAVNQSGYTSSSIQNTTPNRTDSRNAVGGTRYMLQPPGSYQPQEQRQNNSPADSNLAVSAAAALAGAVAYQYADTSSQYQPARIVSPEVRLDPVAKRNVANEPARQSTPINRGRKQARRDSIQPAVAAEVAEPTYAPSRTRRLPAVNESTPNSTSITNLVHATNDPQQSTYEWTEARDSMPTFIDPSQVFNPYHREHELKKQQAEAEAKRQAEQVRQAEEARNVSEAQHAEEGRRAESNQSTGQARQADGPKGTKTKNKSTSVTQTANWKISEAASINAENTSPKTAAAGVSEEEAMAVEMRSFMERMKEFRSKDPSTFLKLWNEMRSKDNTNTSSSTSKQTASNQGPSLDIQDLSVGANVVPHQSISATPSKPPTSTSAGQTGAEALQPPLNGFRVVVENNPDNLPDLGKYPAMRRIRNSYVKKIAQASDAVTANLTSSASVPAACASPTIASPSNSLQPTSTPQPTIPLSTVPSRSFPEAWPEPRRRAVASAAVDLLKSTPVNANNPIIAQDIALLLEQNPSYLDLCSALEQRGLQFSRNSFAKDLLKKVPDLSSVNDPKKPDNLPTQGPSQVAASPTQGNSAGIPHAGPASPNTNHAQVKKSGPSQTHENRKGANASASTTLQMGTKEAAARKRDFSELVDLTLLDDNEDYVAPIKKPRIDNEPVHPDSLMGPPTGANTTKEERGAPPYGAMSNFPTTANGVQSLRFDTQVPVHNMQYAYGPPPIFMGLNVNTKQPTDPRSRTILAKKIDKDAAIERSYYDPRTIARDILIASGRHQGERPLNWHLAGLIHNHTAVDSDLSTIDWDAIDPGGPSPPDVALEDVIVERPKIKQKRRSRKMMEIETRTPTHEAVAPRNRKWIAAPHSAPLNSVPDRTSSPFVKPSNPNRQSCNVATAMSDNNLTPATRRMSRISIDLHNNTPNQPSSLSRSADNTPKTGNPIDPVTGKKRKGRPVGSKNKQPSIASLKKEAKRVYIDLPSQSSPAPATAHAPQPFPNLAQEPKMTEAIPEPVYHECKCRWVHCKVVLHNLAILRRHIPKNHAPKPDEAEQRYACWWKRCPLLTADEHGNIAPGTYFDDEELWLAHIENEHVEPLGRMYGDGSSTSHMDPHKNQLDRERYLSDGNGRQTTPSVNIDGGLSLPLDTLELTRSYPLGPKTDKEKADVTAQNMWLRAHGHKSTELKERADQIIRAMTARKEKIGAGIDRGGCTLINEKRRAGFIQSPGIARIIDAEY